MLYSLHDRFDSARPFPHIVINDFFSPEVASRIETRFPIPNGTTTSEWIAQGWHVGSTTALPCDIEKNRSLIKNHCLWQVYDNPIEGKLANDDVKAMAQYDPIFGSMWSVLQSRKMIDLVKTITSIPNLENDPYLHWLHYHPVTCSERCATSYLHLPMREL